MNVKIGKKEKMLKNNNVKNLNNVKRLKQC